MALGVPHVAIFFASDLVRQGGGACSLSRQRGPPCSAQLARCGPTARNRDMSALPRQSWRMLDLKLPRPCDWCFVGLPKDRECLLEEPFKLGDLVSDIVREAEVVSLGPEECGDPPGIEGSGHGASRWNWSVKLSPLNLDRLFNSRFGLRAYYWVSPHAGSFATKTVLHALWEKAREACCEQIRERAKISYRGISAKVWPDEGDRSFVPKYLFVSRWQGGKPQYAWTPNTGELIIKGAFVFESSGSEYIPASKQDREGEVHRTGFT